MGGGLLELVAHGVQDIYLIGNPQITFFKSIYRRHTNFSIESIQSTFDGNIDFGNKVVASVARNGDLIHQIILEVDLPQITATGGSSISWVNSIGHALIEYVDLEIGGQLIDRQYGEWLEIWSELSVPNSHQTGYNSMVSKYSSFTTVTGPITLYIPLQFWFCRNIGLALPLVALQYHDVKINIKFRQFSDLWTFGPNSYYTASQSGTTVTKTAGPEFTSADVGKKFYWSDGTTSIISSITSTTVVEVDTSATHAVGSSVYSKPNDTPSQTFSITDARLYTDYIFLDTYERNKFAKMRHEYLIEQVQFSENETYTEGTSIQKVSLDFNLPIKELVWVQQIDKYSESNDLFNYADTVDSTQTADDPITKAVIEFNNTERFTERKAEYFRLVQPYQKHTRTPNKFIYVYSFALKPEEHQPSGACNFSKIDMVDLRLTMKSGLTNAKTRVYGINYNVLRIFNGMGGVAFSN